MLQRQERQETVAVNQVRSAPVLLDAEQDKAENILELDAAIWRGDVEAFVAALPERPLFDLVVTSPPYNLGKPYETKASLAEYVEWQARILVEAGLAYGDDADSVAFWDGLAARARGSRDTTLAQIGRRGEQLTVSRERERTGFTPKWIALESSSDGYDVLSQISSDDRRKLTIEVKASERPRSFASFHLTRNEWDRAQDFLNHEFHLWDISDTNPTLAVVSVAQMREHISTDNGEGVWESVVVPFRAFASQFPQCQQD